MLGRGCLLMLGWVILAGVIGYALALLVMFLVVWALKHALSVDAAIFIGVCLGILLWPVLSFLVGSIPFFIIENRKDARRRRFEARPALSDEEFLRLFPEKTTKDVALIVRQELCQLLDRPEVSLRLLPEDEILGTCELLGHVVDDLDYLEFLQSLETRFGGRIPPHCFEPGTLAQLIDGCGRTVPAE